MPAPPFRITAQRSGTPWHVVRANGVLAALNHGDVRLKNVGKERREKGA